MAPVEAPLVSGAWMLRHARAMRTDPLRFLVECSDEFDAVVEFPIPRARVFYVSDPDAIVRILQGNHRAYGKNTVQYRALSAVTGEGLLVSDGSAWMRSRRCVQPAFGQATIDNLGAHVGHAMDRLSGEWSGLATGSVTDVDAAMSRTTLDVVGRALLSTDFGGGAAVVGAVEGALDQVVARARSPLPIPRSVPTPGNARLRRSIAVLDRVIERVVDRRLDGSDGRSADSDPDVLDLLLRAFGSRAGDRRAIRDELVTLIVAGHETVASALSWAIWLVAGDAGVRARLAEESVRGHGDRIRSAPSSADLPLARQVLDEALRLYPPAWVLSRRALADDEAAGIRIPAGAIVIMSPYALHRRPSEWPDPERFDPERFGPGRSDSGRSAIPRRAYLPFGAGPRLCIGREFALVEATLILSALFGRFRIDRLPGHRVSPDAAVTVRPRGGLPMVVRRR
jgi:cytochrome P450